MRQSSMASISNTCRITRCRTNRLHIPGASLADVIRSKEADAREKDRLRRLLDYPPDDG